MPPAPQAIADVGVLSALLPAQALGVFVARGGSRGSYRFPGRDNVTIGTLGRLTTALNRLACLGAAIAATRSCCSVSLRGKDHGGHVPAQTAVVPAADRG